MYTGTGGMTDPDKVKYTDSHTPRMTNVVAHSRIASIQNYMHDLTQ